MTHLIVSREYPPCAYPQGGIGTYVAHIARLLAERGETVHVIGERWSGAPLVREVSCDGRLIVHRVSLAEPLPGTPDDERQQAQAILDGMARSEYPMQAFAWQVALLAEQLVESEGIDCIEGQDYEAPLYYFLLRRATGRGPARRPPCFVHLHSPMQFICHFNDWEISRPEYLMMKRAEDYVIQAADAALCPSRYLARQVERHYGLVPDSVTRIPYPTGDTQRLERTTATWESGSVCYFGRIEARKGLFEWIDAVVAVARERPDLRFEHIGADLWLTPGSRLTVRDALEARIPDDLRETITFIGAQPRDRLWEHLKRARIVAVPSRWENFPNTCVEAMSTGVPVLSSPEGGMVEMIEDGRTGWIAASLRPDDLASALRRALDTPASEKAAMGQAAADSIRRTCNNTETVDRQIAFRRTLAERGAARSLVIPRGHSDLAVRFDRDPRPHVSARTAVRRAAGPTAREPVAEVTTAVELVNLLRSGDAPFAVAFTDAGCRLTPRYAEAVATVLERNETVGLVSGWTTDTMVGDSVLVGPIPQRPYLWTRAELGSAPAFRTEALEDIGWLLADPTGIGAVDVALAVLLHGWHSAVWPEVVSIRVAPADPLQQALVWTARTRVWNVFRDRFPAEVAWDAEELLGLGRTQGKPVERDPTPDEVLQLPMRTKLQLLRKALRDPGAAAVWAVEQGRRAIAGRRTGTATTEDRR